MEREDSGDGYECELVIPLLGLAMKGDENMKWLLLFGITLLAVTVGANSAIDGTNNTAGSKNRLIGAWKLVSLEEPSTNGKLRRIDCAGMFVFTNDGKASVQVMYRQTQNDNAYAHAGYEASYGRYQIDSASTFTFHVDGALVRTLVGKDLKRAYEISGNRLTVKSADPKEHWRVVWERY